MWLKCPVSSPLASLPEGGQGLDGLTQGLGAMLGQQENQRTVLSRGDMQWLLWKSSGDSTKRVRECQAGQIHPGLICLTPSQPRPPAPGLVPGKADHQARHPGSWGVARKMKPAFFPLWPGGPAAERGEVVSDGG